MKHSIISGRAITKALVDAGVVPPNCSRIILDITAYETVKVHYSCFGDTRILTAGIVEQIIDIVGKSSHTGAYLVEDDGA